MLFLTGAYNFAMFAYYVLGKKDESEELRRNSFWHTCLLNLTGAMMMGWDFQRIVPINKLSPGRIMLLSWGLLLLTISACQFYRTFSIWLERRF